jgi:hypothetical protein
MLFWMRGPRWARASKYKYERNWSNVSRLDATSGFIPVGCLCSTESPYYAASPSRPPSIDFKSHVTGLDDTTHATERAKRKNFWRRLRRATGPAAPIRLNAGLKSAGRRCLVGQSQRPANIPLVAPWRVGLSVAASQQKPRHDGRRGLEHPSLPVR